MLVVVMHSMQAIYIHMTGKGAATYWATGLSSVDIFFVISGFVMGISISRWSTNIYARSQAA